MYSKHDNNFIAKPIGVLDTFNSIRLLRCRVVVFTTLKNCIEHSCAIVKNVPLGELHILNGSFYKKSMSSKPRGDATTTQCTHSATTLCIFFFCPLCINKAQCVLYWLEIADPDPVGHRQFVICKNWSCINFKSRKIYPKSRAKDSQCGSYFLVRDNNFLFVSSCTHGIQGYFLRRIRILLQFKFQDLDLHTSDVCWLAKFMHCIVFY